MDDLTFFWRGPEPLLRILLVGTVGYLALVAFLRVSGARTLASLNAFDFTVTVAIGAVFGRTVTAENVALVESVVAVGLLIALQHVVARAQTRWPAFSKVLTAKPALVYYRGAPLADALRQHRLTVDQLEGAARREGYAALSEVGAVVLEPSGVLSVIGPEREVGAVARLGQGEG